MNTKIMTVPDNLASLQPGERLSLLQSLIGNSVRAVQEAGDVFAVMEKCGDPTGMIPVHLRNMLRRVHGQTLLPEVVTNLGGRLRQKVQLLGLEDQRRIAAGGAILLLPSAESEAIEVPAQHLNPRQIGMVFGDGYIRSVEEQRAMLLHPPVRRAPEPPPIKRILDIRADKVRKGLVIEGVFLSRDYLQRQLRQLK